MNANEVSEACPVCGHACQSLPAVDFNKCCEEARGNKLPVAGLPVTYVLCEGCGFCFVPEMHRWTPQAFAERIYNHEYASVDPEYLDARPRRSAESLRSLFPDLPATIRHIDYGGGSGLMSDLLFQAGWDTASYDPFVNPDVALGDVGDADIVTAIEVFEHVPDVHGLFKDLSKLLRPKGVILFTTLLSDGNIKPGEPPLWWYAAPRNGHISLFSRSSLNRIAAQYGFKCGSVSDEAHVMWREMPDWARKVFGAA